MGLFAWLFGRNRPREFSPERLGCTTEVVANCSTKPTLKGNIVCTAALSTL